MLVAYVRSREWWIWLATQVSVLDWWLTHMVSLWINGVMEPRTERSRHDIVFRSQMGLKSFSVFHCQPTTHNLLFASSSDSFHHANMLSEKPHSMAVLWQRHPRLKISPSFRVLCFFWFFCYFIWFKIFFFLSFFSLFTVYYSFSRHLLVTSCQCLAPWQRRQSTSY